MITSNPITKYGIGLVRVSGLKQGLYGDSPKGQKDDMLLRASSLGFSKGEKIIVKKWFEMIKSASGDFQPSQEAIDYCCDPRNNISYMFIRSIDRFTRAGQVIYKQLKSQLVAHGIVLIDCFGIIGSETINTLESTGFSYGWSKFSPTEKMEYMEAERGHDEVRDILTRLIGSEIRYTQLGFWTKPAPPGFKVVKIDTPHGKRAILVAHEIESSWFIKMFELRGNTSLSDEEIVEKINKMGYLSRERAVRSPEDKRIVIGKRGAISLTVKQLQRFIQSPTYCGFVCQFWTNYQPIKAQFDGLVSLELWNKAQRGKQQIAEQKGIYNLIKGEVEQWRLNKNKNNPLYPYKKQVLCPVCRKPLMGSASRGKSGRYFPAYHCSRKHKLYRIPIDNFNTTIDDFVGKLRFSESFFKRLKEIALEEWEKRREDACRASIDLEEKVLLLQKEKQALIDKIKMLTLPAAVTAMEVELEKIDKKLADMIAERDKHEDEAIDIQTVLNYVRYFMEHLKEIILLNPETIQKSTLFGLIFEEPPTYEELISGTPNLAPIFELNQQFKTSKNLSVSRQGLEP